MTPAKRPVLVRIAHGLLDAIHAEARAAYPGECCGLLAGRKGADGALTVTRVVTSPNVALPPAPDRFEVDPQVRLRLMRELAETSESVIGHYHSHPDHPAEPSDTDIDMAFEPDLVWMIVAVKNGTPEDTRAWRVERETRAVKALELSISETA